MLDGVTLGRPCCSSYNCKLPLTNPKHRYCPGHENQYGNICCIKGCTAHKVPGRKTCADRVHQEVENAYNEQGTARFQLQKQLQRAFVSHPDSSEPNAESQDPTEPNVDELIEIEKDTPKGKLKAEFGRRRTHNEQVIVYPCGMILLRETFYGAEGPGSVIVSSPFPSQSSVVTRTGNPPGVNQACVSCSWHRTTTHILRQ